MDKIYHYFLKNTAIANTTLSQYLIDNPQNLYVVACGKTINAISLLKIRDLELSGLEDNQVASFFIKWEPVYEPPCYYKILIIDNSTIVMESSLLEHTSNSTMLNEVTDAEAERKIDGWVISNVLLRDTQGLQDNNSIIYIKDRKILFNTDINYYTLINEDDSSEILTFRMDRFYEGVDLSKKDIYFYCNPVSLGKDNYIKILASNITLVQDKDLKNYTGTEENAIELQLVINNLITDEPGTIPFAIIAEGPAPLTYFWQTYPAALQVDQGVIKPNLKVSDYNIINYNEWQKSVEERLAEQNTWCSLEEIITEEA